MIGDLIVDLSGGHLNTLVIRSKDTGKSPGWHSSCISSYVYSVLVFLIIQRYLRTVACPHQPMNFIMLAYFHSLSSSRMQQAEAEVQTLTKENEKLQKQLQNARMGQSIRFNVLHKYVFYNVCCLTAW